MKEILPFALYRRLLALASLLFYSLWSLNAPLSSPEAPRTTKQRYRTLQRRAIYEIRPKRSLTAWRSRFFCLHALIRIYVPCLQGIFSHLYPLFFWRQHPYLAYEQGHIVKKNLRYLSIISMLMRLKTRTLADMTSKYHSSSTQPFDR